MGCLDTSRVQNAARSVTVPNMTSWLLCVCFFRGGGVEGGQKFSVCVCV